MFKKTNKKNELQSRIDELTVALAGVEPNSEEYKNITSNLEKLNKIKCDNKININTIATIAGSLLGIALIIGAEKSSILSTKAFGFIKRP